ncbi:hypothetical protein RRG08_011876 [Elysia crispata]|uniref:Uncharacterized protein n=1 Tax=Elysia crispata TaxID=231223 RepID=A0AAE0ZMG3_9GAST|nr:hypothetical protein RRG08_011876 [Elysia crispata]
MEVSPVGSNSVISRGRVRVLQLQVCPALLSAISRELFRCGLDRRSRAMLAARAQDGWAPDKKDDNQAQKNLSFSSFSLPGDELTTTLQNGKRDTHAPIYEITWDDFRFCVLNSAPDQYEGEIAANCTATIKAYSLSR